MKRVIKIIACLILAAGIAVLIYPNVRQRIYDKNARSLINEFDQNRQEMSIKSDGMYLADLYKAMQEYNNNLYENGQSGFRDAWSYQKPSFNLSEWGIEDNMVGYIDIPKMNIKLPVYLGASTENMRKGAVHLSETSLPIGGENTNCVLAAHRGYPNAAMFRDIQLLEAGDEVYVTNLWETMTYRVFQIKIIYPDETDKVLIREGEDMLTLITCHPYGDDYQRYVVYCERIK